MLIIKARLRSQITLNFIVKQNTLTYKEENIQSKCGQKRSRLHPFSCADTRPYRAKLFSITEKRRLTTKRSLRDEQGYKNVYKMGSKNGAISEEIDKRRTWRIHFFFNWKDRRFLIAVSRKNIEQRY